MLVSIAVNAECFGDTVVRNAATRRGAERLLAAALSKQAVLVGIQGERFLAEVLTASQKLKTTEGQQIQWLAVELQKDKRESFAAHATALSREGTPYERLKHIAADLNPDVVVCRTKQEADDLRVELPKVKACAIEDFPNSDGEAKRTRWAHAQSLHTLSVQERRDVLGHAIRYSSELTFADGYVATWTIGKKKKGYLLQSFAKAVVYLARLWKEYSALARENQVCVKIVSEAGVMGPDAAVDAGEAREAIKRAIQNADTHNVIRRCTVLLKEDSYPKIFKDRYVGAGRRVWNVRHEIRELYTRQGKKPAHTIFDIDQPANRQALQEIMELKEVD